MVPSSLNLKKVRPRAGVSLQMGSGVIQAASKFISIHCTYYSLSEWCWGSPQGLCMLVECSTTELHAEPYLTGP